TLLPPRCSDRLSLLLGTRMDRQRPGPDKGSAMIDRRHLLAGMAVLPFAARPALAQAGTALHTVRIPGTNEEMPAIGIGTARRYDDPCGEEELVPLRATIARFVEQGG